MHLLISFRLAAAPKPVLSTQSVVKQSVVLTKSHCFAHSSVFVRQVKTWYQVAPVHSRVHAEDDM